MITHQLVPEAPNDDIRHLYETAFPKEEQIPWDELMLLVKSMSLDFTAYFDEDEMIGFTIVYPRKSFNWFWYFAVRPELRGNGRGQKILSYLIDKYKGQTSILDMESPDQDCDNKEQRVRRHDFYLRNGFRDTGVVRTYDTVAMTIMIIGPGTFTMADYDQILKELRAHWDYNS
ncbi:MAG: GNAT family N-acetyltransferase [Prevotella sp.]|nr:GNAT family N-acetyltransferase [Prevotella sp.]